MVFGAQALTFQNMAVDSQIGVLVHRVIKEHVTRSQTVCLKTKHEKEMKQESLYLRVKLHGTTNSAPRAEEQEQ
jgi:hypothetical protein